MASIINASTASGGGIIQTADASGVLQLQSGGTTIASVSSTGLAITGTLSATGGISGALLNIQYFTTAGTATYTATSGTNSVIVEVVGGGGGTTTAGGTSSFGAFCSATGGAGNGNGGTGIGGNLNATCPPAQRNSTYNGSSIVTITLTQNGSPGLLLGFGAGSSRDVTVAANGGTGTATGCGGGGYSREKITSGFNGQLVTVGAVGTGNGSSNAGTDGCVIVYEYA